MNKVLPYPPSLVISRHISSNVMSQSLEIDRLIAAQVNQINQLVLFVLDASGL
jgi:hypothetical protein